MRFVNETRYTWTATILEELLAMPKIQPLLTVPEVRIGYIHPQGCVSLYRGSYDLGRHTISVRLWPYGYVSGQLARKSFIVCLVHELWHHLENTGLVTRKRNTHKLATEFGQEVYAAWRMAHKAAA